MALSTAQKIRILRLLCYPHGTIDPTSLDYSKIVSDKLGLRLSDVAEVEAEELLTWIDQTEDQLDKAIASAGVKRIDDIEFFGDGEGSKADVLRREKSRYIRDLSNLLGIPSMCGSATGNVCV